MLLLTRPQTGRMISGVACGLSELFEVPVALVRILFIAALIATPLAALVYVLLVISVPDEESLANVIQLDEPESPLPVGARFERTTGILLGRLDRRRVTRVLPTHLVAIVLLVFAALLELPRAEGDRFYYAHPLLTAVAGYLTRIGTAIFYLSLAAAFVLPWRRARKLVRLDQPASDRFALDRSSRKMISGVASGLSRVVKIDAAILRAVFILLNILSLGAAALVYFGVAYYMRRKETDAAGDGDHRTYEQAPGAERPYVLKIAIGLLFLLLFIVRVASEYRFFFFSEAFADGFVMAMIGISFAWLGLGVREEKVAPTILAGSAIFFTGVYFLALAAGRVQVTVPGQYEVAEIIGALSIVYFGAVVLAGRGRSVAIQVAVLIVLCALLIQTHVVSPKYLLALGQFYDLFYPIIFAGLGLWIAFER